MSWWVFKIMQGAVFGGALVVLAISLILVNALADGGLFFARLGMGIAILGLLVFLRYLAAPFAAKWIVRVPENWYYVVEDADGYTIEYLSPGRMIVPWRWGSRIVEYVNFSGISATEVIQDALGSDSLPVDVEVMVNLRFDPVKADPDLYPTLRKMNTKEIFQDVITRDLRDIVYRYLSGIATIEGQRDLLHNVESLEQVIAEQLSSAQPLGLSLAANHPVLVRVRVPPKVRDAYQSLWERGQRVREGSKTLLEIKNLASELGISYEDAFQLFYLMQNGPEMTTTTPAGKRRTASQPVVVFQTSPMPEVPPVPSQKATAEHPVVTEPLPTAPEPAAPPSIARLIEDADRAPDPMDLRRQRRDQRRSRRA